MNSGDEGAPGTNPNDVTPLAIHSRPQRVKRVVKDFLVEQAALYHLTQLYAGGGRTSSSRSKRAREESIELDGKATNAVIVDVSAAPCDAGPQPLTIPSQGSLGVDSSTQATLLTPSSQTPPSCFPTRTTSDASIQVSSSSASLAHEERTFGSGSASATPVRRSRSSGSSVARPLQGPSPSRPTPSRSAPPPEGTIFDLTIMTLSRRQASVKILASRTLDELAQRVEALLGIPKRAMRFKKGGVDLVVPDGNHSKALWQYEIKTGDLLLIYLEATASATCTSAIGGVATNLVQSSPFRDRVSLLPEGTPQKAAPPSPYKQIPSWLRSDGATPSKR